MDHDHNTGEVRGLLCTRCNHGLLGKAHDSAKMLRRAVSYLEEPPARTRQPIREFHAEQAELEFVHEQVPFLSDWQAAQSADGVTVAVTARTFLKLVQYAGLRLLIGDRVFTPPQLSIFDGAEKDGHLSELAASLDEAGY